MRTLLRSKTCFATVVLLGTIGAAAVQIPSWDAGFCADVSLWYGLVPLAGVVAVAWCRLGHAPALPQVGTLWRLLALMLLLNATTNPMFFAPPLQPQVALLSAMGCVCLLWALLGAWSLVLWVPLMFLGLAQIVSFLQYGTRFNSLVLAESFEATGEEVAAYFSLSNGALALLGVALVSWYGWMICRVLRPVGRRTLLCTGALFGTLALVSEFLLPQHRQSVEQHFWPVSEVAHLYVSCEEAVRHNIEVVRLAEGLESPAAAPSSCDTLESDSGVVVVLHIGESVRADAMSINGYHRDTTPWLRRNSRVINFPRCISAACDTCQAQIAILTNARRGIYDKTPGMQPTTGSVLELLHKHGFRVFSFFGRRCGQQLKYDRVVRVLSRVSDERFNATGAPWTSLPDMEQVLRRHEKENLVFFINNEGSHTPFDLYDHQNPPFTPAGADFQNPAAHAEEVRNAYDNTIHYTDEFWRRICTMLSGRPFVYLYVSDHGEYLGQNGIWGRGGLGDSRTPYHETAGSRVGMFVVTSPEFDALHPHVTEAVRQLRNHAALTVGHEHIFHTLLGLFHIQTPYYESALDLCSPQVQPYDGPQPTESAE